MKKKIFAVTVVLLCAMFLAGLAAEEAQAQVDIHFVGFCDGMTLAVSGAQVYGNHTGCSPPEPFIGPLAITFDPVQGFLMVLGSNASASSGLAGTFYLSLNPRIFVNYWTAGIGDPPWLFAQGEWDIGPPAAKAAGSSTVPE